MSSHQLDEERIFHFARVLPDTEAQAEYLDQVCAGDQALRERVEELLRVHEQEQSFLKSNGDPPSTEALGELNIACGQKIGRYKLLQKIGEGGFGVVFMAEQSRPVRRKVALKVIKPGMDTEAVVARFEAERQALAMMDHSNIARVFDGGATDGGRPYFVMELVKGVPITEYCDKNELPTEQRLTLFTTVCQAVQHAHQKGIIHRDLKPSNVLVTLADGEPVVKVIDFGVAKAAHQQLTEKTLFTAFGQMVGTPQYMSPEQAEMSCLDVDTRSDVYSLGVLLYELLTGTTPLEGERLRTAGYAEMQRLIREEEPPKPSTRLSTSGDKLTIIAKHRKVTPEKLKSQVKGDLDWIVMKALEKDRARRYETPSALAADVQRLGNDEPILARPPSRQYQMIKFMRRNRVPVTVGLLVLTVMVCGAIGTSVALIWAIDQSNKNKRQLELIRELVQEKEVLLDEYQADLIEKALFLALSGDIKSTRQVAAKLKRLDCPESQLKTIEGVAAFYAGQMGEAERLLRDANDAEPGNVAAAAMLFVLEMYHHEKSNADIRLVEVAQMAPTPGFEYFDRFFQAYAVMWNDPERSRQMYSALLDERPSPLVRAFHAAATAEVGIYLTRNEAAEKWLNEMEQAVLDVQLARAASPPTYIIDLIDLYVRFTAMELRKAAGLDTWSDLRESTDALANRVVATESSGVGLGVAANYYEFTDRVDEAERIYERLVELGSPPSRLACLRFSRSSAEGLEMLSDATADVPVNYVTFLLLTAIETGTLPAGVELKQLIDDFRQTRYVIDVLLIGLAVKDYETVQAEARKLLETELPESFDVAIELRFTRTRLEHLAMEDPPEEWLMERAINNRDVSDANFQTALRHWASGDVGRSQQYFQATLDSDSYWDEDYHWARAFLASVWSR